jgi:hypothetical protein
VDKLVGDQERVGDHALVRRGERVEPAAQLQQSAGADPARELLAHVIRVNVADQQRTGLEQRQFAHRGQQFVEAHGIKLPRMVS